MNIDTVKFDFDGFDKTRKIDASDIGNSLKGIVTLLQMNNYQVDGSCVPKSLRGSADIDWELRPAVSEQGAVEDRLV